MSSNDSHEVIVKNIVLHILDPNIGAPVLSNQEIEPDGEGFDFVENLILKMLDDDNLKKTGFMEEPNRVKELCQNLQAGSGNLLAVSQELARELYQIMARYPGIPPADLVCSYTRIDDQPYLGLLKLNYRTNYIHLVQYDGDLHVNRLVKQKTVLPAENQKPEEAVLISLDDYAVQLVEKEYEMDGRKEFYFSKTYLQCADQLSTAQKAKIISKAAEKLSKKYQHDDFESTVRLRKTVTEAMEENGAVAVESVARRIFHDNPAAQREYIAEVEQAGIVEKEIPLSAKITDRKFRNQKIKTDTGIEINFPAAYFNNQEMLEFINHPDGKISIVIKNVGKISNK
jgi:Mor family transcriptional regulator